MVIKIKRKLVLSLLVFMLLFLCSCSSNLSKQSESKSPKKDTSSTFKIIAEEERLEEAIMFTIYSNEQEIGKFSYARAQELRPLCQEFYGNYIMGKRYIYNTELGEIELLNVISSEMVMDYSIYEGYLATIEKVQGKEPLFQVIVKDMEKDTHKVIHKFKYGNYLYPLMVGLDWGYDGKLYYDSFNGEVPVINVYDPKNDISKELFTSAHAPQTSKDNTKILYYQMGKDLDFRTEEMTLYDLQEKKIISTVEGAYKTFWIGDYLITKMAGIINVYLANSGELVNKFETIGEVFNVKLDSGKLVLDSYILEKLKDGTHVTKEHTEAFNIYIKIS